MSQMFGTIAPRYDFITRAFSYGMDRRWKRLGVDLADLGHSATVLDLACGTGDFSRLVAERLPGARPVGFDLTPGMLRLARSRGVERVVCGDAMCLPFPSESFDCIFIGYGLRNFPRLDAALREIERVTRPGGLLVSLDFFLPENRLLRSLYLGYLFVQGAFWGLVLHGRPRVYTYIPQSLRGFVSFRDFSRLLGKTGYTRVETHPFLFGGIALHRAAK